MHELLMRWRNRRRRTFSVKLESIKSPWSSSRDLRLFVEQSKMGTGSPLEGEGRKRWWRVGNDVNELSFVVGQAWAAGIPEIGVDEDEDEEPMQHVGEKHWHRTPGARGSGGVQSGKDTVPLDRNTEWPCITAEAAEYQSYPRHKERAAGPFWSWNANLS